MASRPARRRRAGFAPVPAGMDARLLADIGVLWCELAYGTHPFGPPVGAALPSRQRSPRFAPWALFSDPEPAGCCGTGRDPPSGGCGKPRPGRR